MKRGKIRRHILNIIYKALNVEIDFARKCEFCFETYTWQTNKRGQFVCEKHMRMLVKKASF
jgi:hypothetical protein